jgi:hypothetical protein
MSEHKARMHGCQFGLEVARAKHGGLWARSVAGGRVHKEICAGEMVDSHPTRHDSCGSGDAGREIRGDGYVPTGPRAPMKLYKRLGAFAYFADGHALRSIISTCRPGTSKHLCVTIPGIGGELVWKIHAFNTWSLPSAYPKRVR